MTTETETPVQPYASLIQAMMTTFTQQVAAQVKADLKSDNSAALEGVLALDPAAMEPLMCSLIENDGDVTEAIKAVAEQVMESNKGRGGDIEEAIDDHKSNDDHLSESDIDDIVDRAFDNRDFSDLVESAISDTDFDEIISEHLDNNIEDRIESWFDDNNECPNEERVSEMIGEVVDSMIKTKVDEHLNYPDFHKHLDETINLKINAVLDSPAFHTRIVGVIAAALTANSKN